MGTRSTTKIYEDGKLILALYKQYDGDIESWGKELKEFIKSGKFVNGISLAEKGKIFNGIGDFALLLVCEFKDGNGDLYATTEKDTQLYNYVIEFNHDKKDYNKVVLVIKCLEESSYHEEINI